MSLTKNKKAVLIDSLLDAFNIPHKSTLILQLNKLDLRTLELINNGIQALQSKKITDYNGKQ